MKRSFDREEMKIDWINMNMRLSGNPISEERAIRIAKGEYVLEATLEEHLLITNLVSVLPLMDTLLNMDEELSAPTLDKFYRKLSGGESPCYRKSTPILFHLSYNPVLPSEIEEELRRLFAGLHRGKGSDPVQRAVTVHNHLIRIYPYDRYSEFIARTALEYELMYSGQGFCPLTLSEQEYNGALAEFLRSGRESVIDRNLELNRLMLSARE